MLDLSSYNRIVGMGAKTEGQARKMQSDMIMERTWDGDIGSRVCYLYDYYHDDEQDKSYNLHPEMSMVKIPIDTKYIISSYKTMDKDQVPYHIQFKPSQECNVDYYKEVFEDRYDTRWPLGLYIDIPDNKGIYRRWIIADYGYSFEPQFDTWCVLPCDHKFQWIVNGKKYEMWGCLRSQNSYNSGIWTDYRVSTVEDQQKFIVPLNRDSETLYYNIRMIIDAKVETEPVAWLISKIKRLAPNGLCRVTLTQDKFDQHKDYIERDEDGKIIGMWCNYFDDVPVYESNKKDEYDNKSEILYSGLKPELKVGGSYKTFTMNYYDSSGNLVDAASYLWKFELNGEEIVPNDLIKVLYPDATNKLEKNQIKIKFIGDDDYLNSVLTIKNDITSLNVNIVGM